MGPAKPLRTADGEKSEHYANGATVEKEKEEEEEKRESSEVDDEDLSELSDYEEFDDNDFEKTMDLLEKAENHKGESKKRKRDNGQLEDQYMARFLGQDESAATGKQQISSGADRDDKANEKSDNSSDNENASDGNRNQITDKDHKNEGEIPMTETGKAESTIFVGNLSSSVITDKLSYKQLKKMFSEYGNVMSIRFRSIAFSEMLPRKVAYIKHKFHSSRDTVHAYIVFKDKMSVNKSLEANGTVFLGNHIRVDSVAHPAKHDNKRSVFIGNLGFEASEEPLWSHFATCGEIEYIRLIRDAKTNVGKGIGYVQFKDSMSVPKALLLDGKKVESADGRKLRVSRAKNIKKPQSSSSLSSKSLKKTTHKKPRLSQDEKTKLGRAKSLVGKAGRSEINAILEGTRAKPGDVTPSSVAKSRKKKPRIRERTKAFKAKQKKAQ